MGEISVKSLKGLLLYGVLLMAVAFASSAAYAATEVDKAAFESAFQDMLADPTDKQKTLHYADMADRVGDHEAAVPPLERLLMQNPDQPDLMVRIGYHYYHLQSYAMAKKYLTDALAMKSIRSNDRNEANKLLADMKWKVY